MSKIAVWFSRVAVFTAVAALAVISAVPEPAYALQASDTSMPPGPAVDKLERAWAREQRIYERLGVFFERVDDRAAKAQALIDRAEANGKDVSALQAALDDVSAAVKQARPIYQGLNGIVASHQGFDDNGKVTDPVKALETVLDMRAKLIEIRDILRPAAKALRQAVHEFRESNPPAPTTAPGGA